MSRPDHCIIAKPHPAAPDWVWVDVCRQGAGHRTVGCGTGKTLRDAVADAIADLDREVLADVIADLLEESTP